MKKYKYISSIAVIFITITISIMSLITPNNEVSELEGRTLEVLPLPAVIRDMFVKDSNPEDKEAEIKDEDNSSVENEALVENVEEIKTEKVQSESAIDIYVKGMLNGDYFKRWDKYFSDHLYLRDTMVNAYTNIQLYTNKKYVNKIYLGEDGYIFSSYNDECFTDEELQERAEYFNSIADEFDSSKVYMVNLPYKSNINSDKMPIKGYFGTSTYYMDKLYEYVNENEIGIIDLYDIFADKEGLYYKTDHHWNMNGTWEGYQYIINSISKDFPQVGEPKTKDYYNIEVYEDHFIGSDGRKAGQLATEMEDIEVYRHKNEEDFIVTIDNKEGKFFYDHHLSKDRFNSDYLVYLNEDYPEVTVENIKADNDLSIVMFGDSMDNPLIPLLAPHFKKIYSYDLRHHDGVLKDTLKDINPDIMMFNGLTNHYIDKKYDLFHIE